jgi:hypothetical protein
MPLFEPTALGYQPREIRDLFALYSQEPHSPQLIQKTWQTIYDYTVNQGKTGKRIQVPPLTMTESELKGVSMKDTRGEHFSPMGLYLAPELTGEKGLVILLQILHKIGMREEWNPNMPYDNEEAGWFLTERSLKIPNLDSTPQQIQAFLTARNRRIIGMNQYLGLAIFNRITTWHFQDKKTFTLLSNGFSENNRIAWACFDEDDSLSMDRTMKFKVHYPWVGAYSVRAIK